MKRFVCILALLLVAAAGTAAADELEFSLDHIYFYNADRVPWYPGFLKAAGIHIPSGAEVIFDYQGLNLIPGGQTHLLFKGGLGLDEREYFLMSEESINLINNRLPGNSETRIPGGLIDPDLLGDETYGSRKDFSSEDETAAGQSFTGEYAQLRSNWGIGLRQVLPVQVNNEMPLRMGLIYDGRYVRNFSDEQMLSDANEVMEKNQLIFLSGEPDRIQYLINQLTLEASWDLHGNPNDSFDHGIREGYSAELFFSMAPGFLNPSIDPGHSSEGIDFAPVDGVTAGYYHTGLDLVVDEPLFDIAPGMEENRFSAYLGSRFSIRWYDRLGKNGRIPLELRSADPLELKGDEFTRRFQSVASIGLYSQLPEWKFIKTYWNSRIRHEFQNEFAENPMFLDYKDDESSWNAETGDYDNRNLTAEMPYKIYHGATLLETELYLEFFSFAKLGAKFIWDFSNADTLGDAGAVIQASPEFTLEILFP
ncbi:hypothetical protein [Salinispira pacifica]|uniref:Alginate export domain-containing protein n=1 Tax=Salinispira pacifica TaxID=1307761 RepID=V5WHU6_9SPIO|nr:hypothetical protein [Salinispira pacifica]AHC15109.1 hypothetical protein L21SP2_1730 [Salinispira pacifica]